MYRSTRQWWVSSAAAILTVAAHLLVAVPIVISGAVRKHSMPDMPGAGASALTSSARLVDAMTLIDLSQTAPTSGPPLEEFSSLGIELQQMTIVIASPDPTFASLPDEDAIEDRDTTEAAGDTQGHALMFGRYLGQVSARIERAWTRPRSDTGASRFTCQTKIEQDEQGKVLSIELRRCNGDTRWQHSLIAAIERASPLPAPPTPSVFARLLVLDFSAAPYMAGHSNAADYEPEARLVAVNDVIEPAQVITNADQTLPDIPKHQGAILLRIEGNKTTWTLQDAPQVAAQEIHAAREPAPPAQGNELRTE